MPTDPRVQAVLERLASASQPAASVRELALSVQLSPSRFSHLFALATGMTPSKFLKLAARDPGLYEAGLRGRIPS